MKLTIKLFLAFTLTLNSTAFATYPDYLQQRIERHKKAGFDTICNWNHPFANELENCSDEDLNRTYVDLELVEQEIASINQQIEKKRSGMSNYGISYAALDTVTLRMLEIGGVLLITSFTTFGLSFLVLAAENTRLSMIPSDSREYKELMRSRLNSFFMKMGFLSLVGAFAIGIPARKIRTIEVRLVDIDKLKQYLHDAQMQLTYRKAIIEANLNSRER